MEHALGHDHINMYERECEMAGSVSACGNRAGIMDAELRLVTFRRVGINSTLRRTYRLSLLLGRTFLRYAEQ